MDENTISYKLNRINTAVERMKTKTGTTGQIIEDVATAVEELSMINNQDKTITNNGTYSADSGFTGLGTVTVNITPNVMEKDITSNGDFISQNDGVDGYNIVKVNVEPLLGTKTVTVNGTYNAGDDMIQGYSSFTVNVPTGGGSSDSNIYRVTTLGERDAIGGAKNEDICVVYDVVIANAKADSNFKKVYFPKTVQLPEAVTGYINISYRAVEPNTFLDIFGEFNSTEFTMRQFDEMSMSEYTIVQYTSEDGITYTRQDNGSGEYTFSSIISYGSPQNWNDAIGYFIQVDTVSFDGMFQYKNGEWNYLDIGANVTPDLIFKDKTAYTNTGLVTGTLCNSISEDFNDSNMKVYKEILKLVDNMEPILVTNETEVSKDIRMIPARSNGDSVVDCSGATDLSSKFANFPNLTTVCGDLKTQNVTNMSRMFYEDRGLTVVSKFDTSNVTDMSNMFGYTYIKELPHYDTSSVTNMGGMLRFSSSLKTIPLLDTRNVTSMGLMFYYCNSLVSIPQLNTSKVTNMNGMFEYSGIIEIPQLDASNVTSISTMFRGCGRLTTLGGLKDLGKAYDSTQSANYSYYTLDLSSSSKLTHDSLMNIINNLYNIKSLGVKTQSVTLGSTNVAKLTSEEISIATNKGWTIS